jgi:ABC-type sugar transport system substrate-binding protein
MKNRLLVLIAVLVMCFMFTLSITIAAADDAKPGEGKVIGAAHFWIGNDWNNELNRGYSEYLEALGYTINITNAQNSTAQQKVDIENFVASGVDGIIIAGGEASAFAEVSMQAKAAGIEVVCIDMVLPGAVASVSADNYTGGIQLGLFLVNQLNGEGKVALLVDPGWQSIALREEMVRLVLGDYEGIEIVASQDVNVDPINTAYSLTKSILLANPDLKGIFCAWGR